ncbi:MAG: hypothetical protein QOC99_1409 [Acidobacteriota bacterium]|jgi:hypothetical protein|nr:hypothetical protein [Acidobacteriota bacterium]
MRRALLIYFACVLVTCLLAPLTKGQESARSQSPTKLSLKVLIFDGAAPTLYPVGDDEKTGMAAIIKDFRRQPASRWRSDTHIDRAALFFRRDGERVRVTVFIYGDENSSNDGVKVAEYVMGEGEGRAVTQLADYGIEPLRVAVVRRAEVKLTPPRVENRTSAVEVTAIDVHENVPSFELTLRNASDKNIRAVEIREMRGRMSKGPPPLFDWRGMSLIEPGKTWKVTLEFGWNSKMTPEGHAVEPPDRVVINSVLFSDGGYEGDSLFAARAEAFKSGRRIQLTRLLEIMREWREPPGIDTREVARELGARVEALECTAEWTAVTELAGLYPLVRGEELDKVKSSIEAGMEWQRSAVLNELKGFVTADNPASDPRVLRKWIKTRREKYEQLLAGI